VEGAHAVLPGDEKAAAKAPEKAPEKAQEKGKD